MYNAHPYFSLKNLGKELHIIHGKIQEFLSNVAHERFLRKCDMSVLRSKYRILPCIMSSYVQHAPKCLVQTFRKKNFLF